MPGFPAQVCFPRESRPLSPLGKCKACLGSSQSWGTGDSWALREEALFTQLRSREKMGRVRSQKPTSNPSSQGQAMIWASQAQGYGGEGGRGEGKKAGQGTSQNSPEPEGQWVSERPGAQSSPWLVSH